ncbi:MAG: hypothetical protein A3D13_07115 [Planctomycetes bacterium RIFCSPHIGHO2_02_FULL_40_12]|nr:MAG: hypothetical protein A3D13_07115 [Planctomycetes bacterium RIFCSPHIGHO2_02_FULL_40_12]
MVGPGSNFSVIIRSEQDGQSRIGILNKSDTVLTIFIFAHEILLNVQEFQSRVCNVSNKTLPACTYSGRFGQVPFGTGGKGKFLCWS